MEQRFVDIDGKQLAFLSGGRANAAPVVFLHGMSLLATDWVPFVDRLGGRPWYATDLPGHGLSEHADQYSLDFDAAALIGFVESVSRPRDHGRPFPWRGGHVPRGGSPPRPRPRDISGGRHSALPDKSEYGASRAA